MNATASTQPLRYRGMNASYADIASRGTADEHLGLAIEYAIHPSGVGCFILRFVVHGKDVDPKNYAHLTYRESAKFLVMATAEKPLAESFKGVRLNKIALPVFAPAVGRHEVDHFATKFNIWPLITEWVAEQVQAEGFTVTVADLQTELRALVVPPVTPDEAVKSVIEFPDLKAPAQKAAALKLVSKPVEEEEESGDDDEDDDDVKEWLN